MKFAGLFLLALFATISSYCQVLRKPVAAAYTGPGAYSINYIDVFSFSSNQASLAQIKNATAGVYSERKFLLTALSSYNGAVALPTSSGNFGLKAGYYGFSDYNETQLGLAYARSLGNKVDLGVQFDYNNIHIAGYGNASAVSVEIGAIMHITGQLHTGIHINNPVGGKFGKDQEEKLPSVYTAGLGYEASEKFFISTEIIKEEDQPVNINAGIQYKFLPQLLVRGGVSTATSSVWIGIGVLWKTFRVDVATTYHPQLGITPGLLILFNFKQKED